MLRTTGGAPESSPSLIRRRQKDKEMKRKKREMYAQEVSFLRNQVKALRLNVRTARMLLPWREVAEALYDDTAAATVTNTNLRSVLRRLQIFHGHVQHLVQTSQPFSVAPALQLESWKDTHLFRGDDMRRSGFEYISQLALHTMPSVLLAPAATPVPSDPSYIQAQIKHGVVYVDVLHACTVPHATLDDVVGVAWAGLNDFVRQAIGTDDCVKFELDAINRTVIEPVDDYTVGVRVLVRFSQPIDSSGQSPLSVAQWLHKLRGGRGDRLDVLEKMTDDHLLDKIVGFFALHHHSMQAMICAKFNRIVPPTQPPSSSRRS
ncbi:hypothetical protein DYB37_004718 [Aphanomyces astaci]|uniref:BZIP domain-containing protein n=2 Tax=Aphanomyces astaci TaxID=112090 RepID=A0A397BXK3_APHAT|nr:hypothetical protein DYB25_007536 [Aphanomyces astaci]RHY69937.1 hypothetical protein DYB34_008647 [Aphanomyces astaci]RHY91794.1 hypothetical protein DYB35_005359 [Aphanomyces astaci]RHZ27527.1 hypothetical protein DYB37_004718 [Aphanomyces astaci]